MLPMGVSMLWENVEPQAALRDRFGFADFHVASEWVVATLESRWGIGDAVCTRLVISDQNAIVWATGDRGPIVVKWSRAVDRFGALSFAASLSDSVSARVDTVSAPVRTGDDQTRTVVGGPSCPLSVTVLPEQFGGWLDIDDRAAVHSAGAALADLHRAFGSVYVESTYTPPASISPRERVLGWLGKFDHQRVPEASRRLRWSITEVPELRSQPQLVHNDFRSANILTRDSRVVGILDFDEVLRDHPVCDLAKASVYLGTLFTDWGPTPRHVQKSFRAGYESVRPLEPTEVHWLEILVLWHGIAAVPAIDSAGWAAAVTPVG